MGHLNKEMRDGNISKRESGLQWHMLNTCKSVNKKFQLRHHAILIFAMLSLIYKQSAN